MKLNEWLSQERGRQAALAERLNIKPPQISAWVGGAKPIPIGHMAEIEACTNGEVSRQELCPDRWRLIWPELAEAVDAGPSTWDGNERRQITAQVTDPDHARREIDRPGAFPPIEGQVAGSEPSPESIAAAGA